MTMENASRMRGRELKTYCDIAANARLKGSCYGNTQHLGGERRLGSLQSAMPGFASQDRESYETHVNGSKVDDR